MKQIIRIFAAIAITSALYSCGTNPTASIGNASNTEENDSDYVYICTGGSSQKYHCNDTCKGLASCSKAVEKVTASYAEEKGRTPCKKCYKQPK